MTKTELLIWTTVNDRLPNEGEFVLSIQHSGSPTVVYREGNRWFNQKTNERVHVTWWARVMGPD